jgi:TonB-dependent SusC/RagA subfamily outer membrane receptor
MLRRFVIGSFAASLVLAGAAGAQTGVISGVILDETNKAPLQGVQVALKGTELVGVTDRNGKFTISGVPTGSAHVEAWRVGYRAFKLSALRIAANDTAKVSFALASNAEDEPMPASDVQLILRNPVSYRSNTRPLIIIDGVIQLDDPVRPPPAGIQIPPEDIETMEIVRGAAAVELYGQRAANGVIRITTKK